MQTVPLKMERAEARELYEKYLGSIHYGEAIDREIMRCYRLLAQGKLIIRAIESIKAAGLGEDGLPKLAIMRADQRQCWLDMWRDGSAAFTAERIYRRGADKRFSLPAGFFPTRQESFRDRMAIVPIVPLHLRPKAKLHNFHILWEADWREVPRDPFLLQRLGKGDLWAVLAMWDLSEVERAALQARV